MNAIMAPGETLKQKALRWADIMGTLTKYYSRRVWVMEMEPFHRPYAVMITEYERRLLIWFHAILFIMFPTVMYVGYGTVAHIMIHSPMPHLPLQPGMDNRHTDFSPWTNQIDQVYTSQCKDCRLMELECKKICYDRLKDLGYEIWGLDRPLSSFILH